MNDLYSFLSLVRHRHLDPKLNLEGDIDKALGAAAKLLSPWWDQQLHKTEKRIVSTPTERPFTREMFEALRNDSAESTCSCAFNKLICKLHG